MYINTQLFYICFSLRKDVFNHRDIHCFSFFNNSSIFYIINIYSDNYQTALKYLIDTEANLYNILVMAGDFNIKNREWDLSYLYHSTHSNLFLEIADFFKLKLSSPVLQVLTCYTNNPNNTNLVINLIFLRPNLVEIDNYNISPES